MSSRVATSTRVEKHNESASMVDRQCDRSFSEHETYSRCGRGEQEDLDGQKFNAVDGDLGRSAYRSGPPARPEPPRG